MTSTTEAPPGDASQGPGRRRRAPLATWSPMGSGGRPREPGDDRPGSRRSDNWWRSRLELGQQWRRQRQRRRPAISASWTMTWARPGRTRWRRLGIAAGRGDRHVRSTKAAQAAVDAGRRRVPVQGLDHRHRPHGRAGHQAHERFGQAALSGALGDVVRPRRCGLLWVIIGASGLLRWSSASRWVGSSARCSALAAHVIRQEARLHLGDQPGGRHPVRPARCEDGVAFGAGGSSRSAASSLRPRVRRSSTSPSRPATASASLLPRPDPPRATASSRSAGEVSSAGAGPSTPPRPRPFAGCPRRDAPGPPR